MNSYILNIETSTKACSVALFNNENLIFLKEHASEDYSHSETLSTYISNIIKESAISFSDLSAIAVSMGPGSYTGLRIGVSTAKGLCYALNIPLISISTLQAMALGISKEIISDLYCPMIDARRMEVYSAFYDFSNNIIREIKADIVDETTYESELEKNVVFFGDGAEKLKATIIHKNAKFIDGFFPSAKYMGVLAFEKFQQNIFEDVAYFEPFYLKDFVSGAKN